MKLSTKKLFTSLKNSPKKRKFKVKHNPKLSSPFVSFNTLSKNLNSNIKQKLFTKTTISNENPFSKSSKVKTKKINKMMSSKNNPKINIDFFKSKDLFNDDESYIDNLLLTSESDSNKYEYKIRGDKKEKTYTKKDEPNFELYNLFKGSNLKNTIVIDDNGNNNLDFEQKKIIDDYFNQKDKKVKNKINTIPVEKYNDNNKLFKQDIPIILSNQKTLDNNRTNKDYKNINIKNNKIQTQRKTKRIINHKKIQSIQQNNNKKINIDNFFMINNQKDISERGSQSIFENYTNRSISSSFLGSSLNDDFYLKLADIN